MSCVGLAGREDSGIGTGAMFKNIYLDTAGKGQVRKVRPCSADGVLFVKLSITALNSWAL